jgi:hypothetical protein
MAPGSSPPAVQPVRFAQISTAFRAARVATAKEEDPGG